MKRISLLARLFLSLTLLLQSPLACVKKPNEQRSNVQANTGVVHQNQDLESLHYFHQMPDPNYLCWYRKKVSLLQWRGSKYMQQAFTPEGKPIGTATELSNESNKSDLKANVNRLLLGPGPIELVDPKKSLSIHRAYLSIKLSQRAQSEKNNSDEEIQQLRDKFEKLKASTSRGALRRFTSSLWSSTFSRRNFFLMLFLLGTPINPAQILVPLILGEVYADTKTIPRMERAEMDEIAKKIARELNGIQEYQDLVRSALTLPGSFLDPKGDDVHISFDENGVISRGFDSEFDLLKLHFTGPGRGLEDMRLHHSVRRVKGLAPKMPDSEWLFWMHSFVSEYVGLQSTLVERTEPISEYPGKRKEQEEALLQSHVMGDPCPPKPVGLMAN